MAGKKRKKQRKHPKLWLSFKVVLLLFLLTILVGGIIFYFKYGKDIFAMQDEAKALVKASSTETFRASETSIVYNNKGNEIAKLKGDKDSYYVESDDLPQYAKDAVIVTEDKKFYSHNGIDMKGIMRAFWALVKNNGEKKQGASTITQQLARVIFLSTEKTYERKIKEIFIARELEKKYTKEQILEFYLNSIYYMNGYYGLEAASRGYFNKSCNELSLAQIAFLSAIPNNPTLYDPLKNYDNTVKRKNRILDQMLEDKAITQVQYDEAYNEKIKLNMQEVKKRDYIQTFVSYCAIRELMEVNGFEFRNDFVSKKERKQYEKEYEEEYSIAQQMLKNNGYKIYTSIDLKKQKKLQQAVNSNLSAFKEKETNGTYKMQGSAVCIDNKNGRVVAIVGGRSQETEGYSLNRAFQSFRQPGSSIKPLIVYTPTLERGSTASTTVHDYKFKDGPSNSDGTYSGYISMRYAVEKSKNTVAWQLFDELKPEVGLQYLLDMNFSKIVKSDYYLSASLGGLTYGTSTLEMASAYSALENDGKYREPTCIVKILDGEGKEIVSDHVEQETIYKKDAAHSMTDILTGVITRGTARGLGLDNGQPSAGKTGTTNDKKDGWFCGYTPYYTTAVWVGYDSPKTVNDLYGSTYPGRIWHDYMSELHKNLEIKEFSLEGIPENDNSPSHYDNPDEDKEPERKDKIDEDSDDDRDVDRDSDDDNNKVDKDTDDNPPRDDAEKQTPTPKPDITEPPATEEPEEQPPDDNPDEVDDMGVPE